MYEVKIPATSANLGPGFDALGIALDLYNSYIFEEIDGGIEISGFEEDFNSLENLVYKSMLETFEIIGYQPRGVRIVAECQIPMSRGLGSSAACILGGVIGANLLAGKPLSKDEIFRIATNIEGHPDNIAPALFGGFVTSIMEGEEVYYNKIDLVNGIKFVALIPDFTLSTKAAREVLPKSISYEDGVFNVGRVALLISTLQNGRYDLLNYALKDRLHQPYRGKLIQGYEEIFSKCEKLGALGVYLSGAGPTIMAIVENNNNTFFRKISNYMKLKKFNWNIIELSLNLSGALINKMVNSRMINIV